MSAAQKIKRRIRETNSTKDKILELDLGGIPIRQVTSEITKLLEQCVGLNLLILSHCQLESLSGLPNVQLKGIDVSNNKLTDTDIKYLKKYTLLTELIISENRFQTVESLKQLSGCKELTQIDIRNNPVTKIPGYRQFLFQNISSLQSVDGIDVEGKYLDEEEESSDFNEDGSDQEFSKEEDHSEDDFQSEQSQPKKKTKNK